MSNFYPAIPDPQNNTESLSETTRALKMAVETLSGQRDGGAATRVFEQTDEPKDPRVGDTWVEKKDAGRIRLWNGSFWVDVSDSRFSILEKSTADASAMIKELSQVRVTDTEAFAQKILEMEARFKDNVASIYDEMTVRATATEALAQRITSLSATFNATNYSIAASVSSEALARATADSAVASAITSVSAGTSRVYTQATAPGNTVGSIGYPRVLGDVWYDTTIPAGQVAPAFTPYVWAPSTAGGTDYAWRDNSSGDYTKYVGQIASINTIATAAYYGNGGSAFGNYKNTVANYWALRGTLGGTSNNILTVTGVRTVDGNTPADYKIVFGDGSATTTVQIYGNLIVNGTVTVNGDGTSPIAANAVSEGDVGFGAGSASAWVTAKAPSDAFLVIASYAGGDTAAIADINGYLQIRQSGVNIGTAAPIKGFVISGTTGYNPALPTAYNLLYGNFQTGSVTAMVKVTGLPINTGINFSAVTGFTAQTVIYVVRLSR